MEGLSSLKTDYQNQFNYYLNSNNNYYSHGNYQESSKFDSPERTVITAGLLQAFALFLHKASEWCGNKLMQGKEFTTSENVKQIAQNMVKKNKLNVFVDFIDKNNMNNYTQPLKEALKPVARGENAFYSDQFKLAVAPKSKPSLILHELGHAINAHKSKILQMLQKSRMYVSAVPTALLMINGLLKKDSNTSNFIEENAGKIGFAAFLPTIIEEGLASIRGLKAAKATLGKSVNLNPLKRNYFFAWLTYLIAGIGLGIAAKQSIIENKR